MLLNIAYYMTLLTGFIYYMIWVLTRRVGTLLVNTHITLDLLCLYNML